MYDSVDIHAKTTLAATFMSRDAALNAADDLKEAGFIEIWIGLAKHDETDVPVDEPSVAGSQTRVEAENWFQRWFGEGDESLHDALVQRGVAEADVRNVSAARKFVAVLTVDGGTDPDQAAGIMRQADGKLLNSGYTALELQPITKPGEPRSGARADWRETVFAERRPVANDAPLMDE